MTHQRLFAPAQPVQAPHRTSQHKRGSIPYLLYFAGAAVAAGAALMAAIVFVVITTLSEERIPAGVQVARFDIGGQTTAYAEAQLNQLFASQPITISDNERSWQISAAELGVTIDMAYTIAAALAAEPGAVLTPHLNIDLTQAQDGLIALSGIINLEASSSAPGRAVEIPVVLDRLRVNVSAELEDGVLELSMIEVPYPTSSPSVASYTGETSEHIVQAGEELGLIARLYNVSLDDLVSMNSISDPNLIYAGQRLIIPASGIYEPSASDAPPAPTNAGRSLLVSISRQRLYAYENGQLVHSHLVSTGLPETPTVLGDFNVYVKYTATDMSGPGYYLPQVPYTMYFYQGYGIHGTYWHNNFGRPMSHGCVNLPVDQAAWFFNFAEVGTPVRVIA